MQSPVEAFYAFDMDQALQVCSGCVADHSNRLAVGFDHHACSLYECTSTHSRLGACRGEVPSGSRCCSTDNRDCYRVAARSKWHGKQLQVRRCSCCEAGRKRTIFSLHCMDGPMHGRISIGVY
jgi:hypothetical protein